MEMKEIGPRGVWAARPSSTPLVQPMHVTKEISPSLTSAVSLRVSDSLVLLRTLFSRGVAYRYSVFTDNRFCQVIACCVMFCVLSPWRI